MEGSIPGSFRWGLEWRGQLGSPACRSAFRQVLRYRPDGGQGGSRHAEELPLHVEHRQRLQPGIPVQLPQLRLRTPAPGGHQGEGDRASGPVGLLRGPGRPVDVGDSHLGRVGRHGQALRRWRGGRLWQGSRHHCRHWRPEPQHHRPLALEGCEFQGPGGQLPRLRQGLGRWTGQEHQHCRRQHPQERTGGRTHRCPGLP